MRYILPCLLGDLIRECHRDLVEEIATRFDLPFTQRQAIPAHFTLKYHFETPDIAPAEELLDRNPRDAVPALRSSQQQRARRPLAAPLRGRDAGGEGTPGEGQESLLISGNPRPAEQLRPFLGASPLEFSAV